MEEHFSKQNHLTKRLSKLEAQLNFTMNENVNLRKALDLFHEEFLVSKVSGRMFSTLALEIIFKEKPRFLF